MLTVQYQGALTKTLVTATRKAKESFIHVGSDNNKTTTLQMHHTFLYISLPSLHDQDMRLNKKKRLNFTLYEGHDHEKTIILIFLFLN